MIVNQNKIAGLSAKEASLIAILSGKGLRIFTTRSAAELLGTSHQTIAKLAHTLVRKRKLQHLEKGKYLIIPPEAWKAGEYTEEGIIIASQLISPYYLSYWSALLFYGWTEQPSNTVFLATTKLKRPMEIQGMKFRFVRLKPSRFFGFEERWVGNQKVVVADKEKTIIDALDQPRYTGEIVEIAKGLWNGRKDFDYAKMLEYAKRMDNGAILKRLGYLIDALRIDAPDFKKAALKFLSPNLAPLDPGYHRDAISVNHKWRVIVTVNPRSLTEWRRH